MKALNDLRATSLVLLLAALAGVSLAERAAPLPGSAPAYAAPATSPPAAAPRWTPQIAFQYYGTDDIDPQFLAEHIDWLMMRYGAENLRDEVQESGYHHVLPQYLLLFQIYGPGPYKNSDKRCKNSYTPLQNNVMWTRDFCEQVHSHEDWFLHNRKGERLYKKERIWDGTEAYQYYMNPGSPGFRRFWVAQVRRQQEAGWQSLFLDNVAATYDYISTRVDNKDRRMAEYRSQAEWQTAVVGMLRAIREAFPERQVWGNITEAPAAASAWDRYRAELDGIQEERFATNWVGQPPLSPRDWDAMLARIERTLAAGKGVVLYGQGHQNDFPRMRFSLASYLLVATPDQRATFRYTHTRSYETLWWYPEYELNLGAPRGPRFRDDDRWLREFACGLVVVNPARQQADIEALPCES